MNKVAIVTGGSRGIGAATACALAKQGYAVGINYLNSQDEANTLVEYIQKNQGKAIAVQADMGSEQDILRLFNEVDNTLGPVTALINNAGITGGMCSVENISLTQLQQVFAINVFGTVIACREAVKRMKPVGGGSIVNISSEAAKFGGTQLSHYAASKSAINTFTIGFSREVAMHQIRVNVVSPGVIDTDMHQSSPKERLEQLLKTLPMQRMGRPDEVSALITWLVSDAASYISGAIIPVTGSR